METPLPPGAMYFLLLVCYLTFAAMGNVTTPESNTYTSYSQVVHQSSETRTYAYTTLEEHKNLTQKEATDRTVSVYQSSETRTLFSTSQPEVKTQDTQDIDLKTTGFVEHYSTHNNESHSTRRHSGVTMKELPSSLGKVQLPLVTSSFVEHYSTHNNESHSTRRHSGVTMKELPSSLGKVQLPLVTSKSISIPNVSIKFIDNKFHIRCICELGPEVINYELILGDQIVRNMTVHGKEAATFQFNITPATSSQLYCRARTLSGEEATSQLMRILGDTPESEDKVVDKTKSDKEERDAEPKFLISLIHILTSVSQPVQDVNNIIISVCGSVLLALPLFILGVHFYKHRVKKVEPTLSYSV